MQNTKKEKRVKRKDHKYPALIPQLNLRTRRDEIEDIYSYIHTLNDEEKEWLNKFATEEIVCSMDHEGEKLNTQLTNLPKGERSAEEVEVRQRLNLKNNARNRCIYTQEAAQGTLNYIDELFNEEEEEAVFEEFNGTEYEN